MRIGERPGWPVLRRFDREHLARIGLPLGGVGTGTVSFGGRGNLYDWEITNSPAKGFNGGQALFLLYAHGRSGPPVLRALEGILQPPYEGARGARAAWSGLPRFRECRFAAAYPLGQALLADPSVPVEVRIEAFNPLVPADAEASGLPVAVLRFALWNLSDEPLRLSVAASVRNYVADLAKGGAVAEAVRYVEVEGLSGLLLRPVNVAPAAREWGTIALATTAQDISHKAGWPDRRLPDALLHVWDDLLSDGRLSASAAPVHPIGSLAAHVELPAGGEGEVTFLLGWHMPNRQTWTPSVCTDEGQACCESNGNRVGNYYATLYEDAWDVVCRLAPRLEDLERRTVAFVEAFVASDLPDVVKEAALSNLSTLRSETCFRTKDGRFYGWEGCCDDVGCCYGSCTHVWNYEQATAHLFGELARSMREVEFLHATDARGRMAFRVNLPLERARDYPYAAADGQMGCIMKAYRDWRLSGDDDLLRRIWPGVRRALEFCWEPGGWDADRDGVMEGCQHHTLDVEYYGPNPLTGVWYLGALRAAEEMARYLGEEGFANTCREMFGRGRAWVDAELFNGEYYEQRVVPPGEGERIAEGLRSNMGAEALEDPDFQLGPGCLVDQLVGQYMAHVCHLGYLLDPDHVRTTLESILQYNGRADLYDHMNYMRTFALNDEAALLMCTWPHGGRPRTPVRFHTEVMTGFEYAAAVHMLYEGAVEEGLRCIANIRARYDGRRRNPFDEAECGHHYARAMASWAAVLALSGFDYSGVTGEMRFRGGPGQHFWSTGDAWGTCTLKERDERVTATLRVLGGRLRLRKLRFGRGAEFMLGQTATLSAGESQSFSV